MRSTADKALYADGDAGDTGPQGDSVGYTTDRGGQMVEQDKRRLADQEKRSLADQDPASNAGMAAEIERLRNELAEAREQLAATGEVLAVIARSASDLE